MVCVSAYAQTRNHLGLFPTLDHSGTLSNRWEYSFYYFGGFNLFNSKINEIREKPNFFVFYAEQAMTYKWSDRLSFTASYVYERQRPVSGSYRNEQRIYLQSTYKYNLDKATLKHRLRYDVRFIEDRITGKSPFTSRIRYLFGTMIPMGTKTYFSAYNEFFFNTFNNAPTIYGENWAYLGLGYDFGNVGKLEAGPLYIFWANSPNKGLTNFYYLQFTWITHLDFRKNGNAQ